MILFDRNAVTVRKSQLEDILVLRKTMREEDRQEIWAQNHFTPESALLVGYLHGYACYTILHRGIPIAMFGLTRETQESDRACVWFLGSDGIDQVKKTFLVICRLFIDHLLKLFPVLYNYVDARYRKSVDWLRWCGAEIEAERPYGIEGRPFHYITFRRA